MCYFFHNICKSLKNKQKKCLWVRVKSTSTAEDAGFFIQVLLQKCKIMFVAKIYLQQVFDL